MYYQNYRRRLRSPDETKQRNDEPTPTQNLQPSTAEPTTAAKPSSCSRAKMRRRIRAVAAANAAAAAASANSRVTTPCADADSASVSSNHSSDTKSTTISSACSTSCSSSGPLSPSSTSSSISPVYAKKSSISTNAHISSKRVDAVATDLQRISIAEQVPSTSVGSISLRSVSQLTRRKHLVVLLSNGVSDRKQSSQQINALRILKARQTSYEVVDGMDLNQRTRRNELFDISGIRANYPQFFWKYEHDGSTEYMGDYDRIENLNEMESLPADILLANPDLETWDSVFDDDVIDPCET